MTHATKFRRKDGRKVGKNDGQQLTKEENDTQNWKDKQLAPDEDEFEG